MGEDALKQKVFEALAFDPLATAEHITGQHYTEDRETSGLGLRLSMRNNFVKNVILGELGDTHYRISWKKFLEIIDDLGFDIVEDRQFEYVLGQWQKIVLIELDGPRDRQIILSFLS